MKTTEVKFSFFLKHQIKNLDVYVLVDQKLRKILSCSDPFDLKKLDELFMKGLEIYHIPQLSYQEILNQQLIILEKVLPDVVDVSEENLNYTKDKVKELHFSEQEFEQFKLKLDNVIAKFNKTKSKKVKTLILELFTSQGYLVDHAILTAFICILLQEKLGWRSEVNEERVLMAAALKDCIHNSPILSKVRHNDEIDTLSIDRRFKKVLHGYYNEISSLFEQIEMDDPEIKNILINCHELPDGSGYPRKLGENAVTGLSALFNVSMYFSQEYLGRFISGKSVEDIKKEMNVVFSRGNYKKPLQALMEIL
ncbi:MAG: hypothetical protein ACOYL6_02075 [Bacteriovoracaceae bacterium]